MAYLGNHVVNKLYVDQPVDSMLAGKAVDAYNYTNGQLTSIDYETGHSANFNYVDGKLSTIVYTYGVETVLTQTYTYTDGKLTSITRT